MKARLLFFLYQESLYSVLSFLFIRNLRMISYLIVLISCLLSISAFSYDEETKEEFLLSTPEQIATLSSEPNYLVGGLISPQTPYRGCWHDRNRG